VGCDQAGPPLAVTCEQVNDAVSAPGDALVAAARA
jgi:hypothetical protein